MTQTRTGSGIDMPRTSRTRANMPNPPPPPPVPTLADAIAHLVDASADNARILQAIAQNMAPGPRGHHNHGGNNTYADFLKTQPPIFLRAREPLEADDWIRTIEQKLGLIHCNKNQKTLFAAQQLQGLAGAWWASYLATQLEGYQVPWAEFRESFWAHHIPEGVMEMKLEEFPRLQQGGRSVMQYVGEFNYLSQYAPEHVNNDHKKKKCFMRGLNSKLQTMLTTCTNATYNELVNMAITTEEKNRQHKEAKKRKNVSMTSFGSSSQRQRIAYRPVYRPPYRPPQ